MAAKYFTHCFIKIGGSDVSQEFMNALIEVVVDTSLHLPDMFTISLNDPGLKWVDDSLLDIGKEVEIKVQTGSEQGGLEGTLIKGEITALEPRFSSDPPTSLLVRGYDKSHRLHRGEKTRTFLSQTDDGIVGTIAGEVGLTAEADAPGITHDFVMQNNQTNMEFLLARAARIGYQVYAADGKLYFKKGDASLGTGPELKLGENLDSFRPCMTAAHQADTMIVRGWDAKAKEAITSQKTPNRDLDQGGMTQAGGDKTAAAFGSAEAVVVDRPVFTVDEARALATGLSNDISREFIEAEGVCAGHPQVKAGWKITARNVGSRFSGTYFVTSATHAYNKNGYQTTFSISGRQPNLVSYLVASGNGHNQGGGPMQGVVTAMVTNLNDPDNLGRVKVKYPWLGEDPAIESDWVRIASPMGGAERGFFYLPEVNDEVLVAFEHGDVHRPYLMGAVWSNTDKPPLATNDAVANGKVKQRIIKSTSGHVIILDDTQGEEQIIIRDKTEKNEIVIDSSSNSMTIKVEGDFTVEAGGKINLTSTKDMTLESKAKGTIDIGGNLAVNAKGNLNLDAKGNGSVKGAQLTLEGTAKSELKAPMVSVNGSAMTEIKGGIVKIN